MDFHRLELADRPIFEQALSASALFADYRGSELNFANLYVWRRFDDIECAVAEDGTVFSRGVHNGVYFAFPPIAASEERFVAALARLEREAATTNIPFLVRGLTARLADVARRSGRRYRIDEERDLFEYLYDAEGLRTLAGNRYHAKRNFLNRFLKNGDYVFRPYAPADRDAVEGMLFRWERAKLQAFEHEAILDILDHLDRLASFADLLFVGDRLAAFAIGTFAGGAGLVLFEKGDTGFPGVYAAINYLFANAHFRDVALINRQEDIGIPELRKAKLSYNPVGFVEKYSLVRDHLSAADVAALKSLYAEAFPDSPAYVDFFFRRKYRSDNVVVRHADGRLVSALHFVRKSVSVRGKEFPVPFVAAAATRRDVRGQGHMTALIRQSLGELYNRKTALCALSPFDESFYARFGFVTVCTMRTETLPAIAADGRTTRIAKSDDLPVLDTLYRRRMEGYDVYVERRLDAWTEFFQEVAADGGEIVIVCENDEPVGYFTRFGGHVEELVIPDEAFAGTYAALAGLEVDREGGADDPARVMIRIVDVVRFLETYPYDLRADCSRRIRIVDPFFPQNDIAVEWVVANGEAKVREIGTADDTISIADLAAMAFRDGVCPFGGARTLIFDRY